MNKYKLLAALLVCSHFALGQRYGISAEGGKVGLKIFGIICLLVFGITIILYIRQRITKK
jgi:hypothetical protein